MKLGGDGQGDSLIAVRGLISGSANPASFVEVPAVTVPRHVVPKAITFLKNPSAPRASIGFNEHHDIRLIISFRESRCDGAVHDRRVRVLNIVRFEYQY